MSDAIAYLLVASQLLTAVVGVVFLVSGTDDLSLTSVIWCGSSTSACL